MSDEQNTEIDELKAAIEALSAKNRELLGEVKLAKAKVKADISPEDYAAIQNEVDALKASLEKAAKDSAKTVDGLNKQLAEKDSALQSYLIDNGLSDAMIKVGVRPEMMGAVKALLKSQTLIKVEGGAYSAMMGELPLAEAVAGWAASDDGKPFVTAPANSGGGAAGANGNGASIQPKGNLSGDKQQRLDAIKSRFPELNN